MRTLLTGLAMLTAACGLLRGTRPPSVYEVPEGFRGWVLIQYSRPGCPPLPIRGGKRIFRLSQDGYLCTSTTPEFGWARDEYYFVGASRQPIKETGWGGGGLIWGRSNGSCRAADQLEAITEHHFIGTEDEFREAPERPWPAECEQR